MNSELKVIRWDYRMADNILEIKLQEDDDKLQKMLSSKGIEKRVMLRTCNRLEIYFHDEAKFYR